MFAKWLNRMGWRAVLAWVLASGLALPAWAMDLDQQVDFSIAPQKLSTALLEFSHQAKIQLAVGPELGERRSDGLSGRYSIGDALTRLLGPSGLKYRVINDTAISISADQSAADGGRSQTTTLSSVEVTGSRLARTAREGAQDVKVYTRQQIDQSGQGTITQFLNTLPDVSVSSTDNLGGAFANATTVQLHGLPAGTTLVLINGRRIQASGVTGTSGNFFDLNNIPMDAVDRIEVVPTGSSAVYGSDAIAGVVNIVLKKGYSGVEANARYGWASGIDEHDDSIAIGHDWGKASVSALVGFQTRAALRGTERDISANTDYSRFGGPNNSVAVMCQRANIFFPSGYSFDGATTVQYAGVPSGYTGAPSVTEFAGTAGQLNTCPPSYQTKSDLMPATRKISALLSGSYDFTDSVEAFTEILYSHNQVNTDLGPSIAYGAPGFQLLTVAAANPYNPFGQTVGVAALIPGLENDYAIDTVFFRSLIGLRGNLFSRWQWEIAAWQSSDRSFVAQGEPSDAPGIQAALNSTDPATALNPFVDGPWGSSALLHKVDPDWLDNFKGQSRTVSGFIRGPLFQMASGSVDVVIGGEYDRDTYFRSNVSNPYDYPGSSTFHRDSHAAFAEARIPILANHANPQAGDVLAATVAGRYDDYSLFGSKVTPQFGGEWRPADSLLVRATYGRAFRAPSLLSLYGPTATQSAVVTDPLTGASELATLTSGSNTGLHPETGQSRSFGFVYSSKQIDGLQLSVTHWGIDMTNNVQDLDAQAIVDNAALFPGDVVRGADQNGQPGPITAIRAGFVNFGQINVAGFDYQVNYRARSSVGEWTPYLSAAEIYHYTYLLTPGAVPTDATSKAQSTNTWAPRWKGTVGTGWKLAEFSANVDGRYVGHYQDYAPLLNGTYQNLGDFWLFDASVRWDLGKRFYADNALLKKSYVEIGGVNLLDNLPQYSIGGPGSQGFDISQADIRGRFIYAQIGVKW